MGLELHDLLDNETFRKPPLISTRTIRIPDEGSRSRGAGKKKFSHTRYRALGPELIPVYRQSARR